MDCHFGDLEREVTKMITTKDAEGNDVVDNAMLEELGWATQGRRTKFEALLEGALPDSRIELPCSVDPVSSKDACVRH